MRIGIINGPNLNLIGTREPEIYGTESFLDWLDQWKKANPTIEISYFQSNIEGELVQAVQDLSRDCVALVLNAGAYTHTSIALGDAVAAVAVPAIEVHISNVYKREGFRHNSYIAPHAAGVISGLGLESYAVALGYLIQTNTKN